MDLLLKMDKMILGFIYLKDLFTGRRNKRYAVWEGGNGNYYVC